MRGAERSASGLTGAFREARAGFLAVFIVSLFLNLLHLASPIYMMQTFDRVLTTGNTATLLLLTLMVIAALITLGALDALRQTLLSRTAGWAADGAREEVVASAFRASLRAGERSAQPVRDLRQVQSFLSGQGVLPLVDAPWTPIFIAIIWLMHPALGLVALLSALCLFGFAIANGRVRA